MRMHLQSGAESRLAAASSDPVLDAHASGHARIWTRTHLDAHASGCARIWMRTTVAGDAASVDAHAFAVGLFDDGFMLQLMRTHLDPSACGTTGIRMACPRVAARPYPRTAAVGGVAHRPLAPTGRGWPERRILAGQERHRPATARVGQAASDDRLS